jgi:tol-pal system protein YbgF
MAGRIAACALLAIWVGGCASQQSELRRQYAQLQAELAELNAQRRRERRQIRALRRKLALAEGQARSVSKLPVEIVEPEPSPEPRAAPPAVPGEADVEVAYADDALEVLYVGEAARKDSVRPPVPRYMDAARTAGTGTSDRVAQSAGAEPQRGPAALPEAATLPKQLPVPEHLPVIEGPVPPIPTTPRRATTPAAPAPRPGVERRESQPAPAAATSGARRADSARAPDPRAIYQRHYEALRAGRHGEAIAGFRQFLAEHPDHVLADNAQYWLAEAFYDQRLFLKALAEFSKVPRQFPAGNKVADAMLKVGFCHEQLGNLDDARRALRQVVSEYADSNAAALAADRLAVLEARQQGE